MASQNYGELAIFGGQPAYEQGARSAQEALRALMPDETLAMFDSNRAIVSGLGALVGAKFAELAEDVDEAISLALFFGQNRRLPFRLVLREPWRDYGAELHYDPEPSWERDLPPEAVVSLLAKELGLESAEVGLGSERSEWSDYPPNGILRIPARFFRKGRALGVIRQALDKLSEAYHNPTKRPQLIEWANQFER